MKAKPGESAPGERSKLQEGKPDQKAQDNKPTDEQRHKELEALQRRISSERMKLAHDARKEKEERAKREEDFKRREAKLAEWEAREADRRRNPVKYLSEAYGPNWYDTVTKIKVEGTPTPDLVASEMEDRFSSFEKKWEEREAKLREEHAAEIRAIREESEAKERETFERNALAHVSSNPDKYPLIHAAEAQNNVLSVIWSHFDKTTTRNEDGEVVPGELLSPEQAAQQLETYIGKLADAALKKKSAQAGAQNSATSRTQSLPRRTLSTDMNGAPSGWVPPKDDREREERANAAWEAVRSARS